MAMRPESRIVERCIFDETNGIYLMNEGEGLANNSLLKVNLDWTRTVPFSDYMRE